MDEQPGTYQGIKRKDYWHMQQLGRTVIHYDYLTKPDSKTTKFHLNDSLEKAKL